MFILPDWEVGFFRRSQDRSKYLLVEFDYGVVLSLLNGDGIEDTLQETNIAMMVLTRKDGDFHGLC